MIKNTRKGDVEVKHNICENHKKNPKGEFVGCTCSSIYMKKEKAEQIYTEIEAEWIKKHGKENLNQEFLAKLRKVIPMMPADENGNKLVTNMDTGKSHLVPIKDIILKGLKGEDVCNYPEAKNEEKTI